MSKPKKNSLISNLLNRVDDKSLAIKQIPNKTFIYWSTINIQHYKATKEILSSLSYDELSDLLNGFKHEFVISDNFNDFEEHIPGRETPTLKKEAILVSSYKTIDKIGTSKGEVEIFHKNKK